MVFSLATIQSCVDCIVFEADKYNGHRRFQQVYRRPDSHLFHLNMSNKVHLPQDKVLWIISLTPVGCLHSNRLINITNVHAWDKWKNGWCEQWVLLQTLKMASKTDCSTDYDQMFYCYHQFRGEPQAGVRQVLCLAGQRTACSKRSKPKIKPTRQQL